MVTYIMMATFVALLAGLTGGMPAPIVRRPHPRPAGDAAADEYAAGASSRISDVESNLPLEMADGERRCVSGQAAEQCCDWVSENLPVPPMQQTDFSQVADPVVLATTRRGLLDEIVNSLMRGTQFVALTGVRGAGKTAMAAAVCQELSSRSVGVRCVDGGGGGIPLRAIMSRVLGKSESDIGAEDIERLFDAMTDRETGDEKLVLIIDDAERLLPDAIGYLRLLASVTMQRMPQIVFIGEPSFWDIAIGTAGFTELIMARFELPQPSQQEKRLAAEQNLSALGPEVAQSAVKHRSSVVALLVSLVASIRAMTANRHGSRASAVPHPLLNLWRDRRIMRTAGAVAVLVGVVGVPSFRPAPPSADVGSLRAKNSVGSVPMITIRLPSSDQTAMTASRSSDTQLATPPERTTLSDSRNGSTAPPRKLVAKAKIVQEQRRLGGDPMGSTTGTWLFQANPNDGANS
jgi:type II secretory pathway predicted ATPase ExeA